MALAGGFFRKDLWGRSILSFLFTFTMLFSGGMIPNYLLVRSLGMIDTVWAMVIPGAMSVYNMIVARTFIQSNIPEELLEATRIDGCDDIGFFFRMVLPLSKAIISVLVLWYAICFTAKHHDGFAMYDSKVSDYNIIHTPFGRDVVKELARACEKRGIVFCLYYSQMQDWEDENADGNTWDFDAEKKDFRIYFENKVKPQVKELLTNYGKIGMLWFDTPYDMPVELCRELRQWVLSIQPECIINGRIGYGLGDYRQMGDNDIPVLGYLGDWETPMTLNNTWGYATSDENWKGPMVIMKMLIDVAGKGGNLLLNVGPDALGNIPAGGDKIMRTMGDWLKINGESIYGTRRTIDFPYQIRWGGLTSKGNTLYMHVMNTKEHADEIKICNLETRVKRVYLLETGEELPFFQSYEIARDEHRFRVQIKDKCKDPLNTVIVVELEDAPAVHSLYMNFADYFPQNAK